MRYSGIDGHIIKYDDGEKCIDHLSREILCCNYNICQIRKDITSYREHSIYNGINQKDCPLYIPSMGYSSLEYQRPKDLLTEEEKKQHIKEYDEMWERIQPVIEQPSVSEYEDI